MEGFVVLGEACHDVANHADKKADAFGEVSAAAAQERRILSCMQHFDAHDLFANGGT